MISQSLFFLITMFMVCMVPSIAHNFVRRGDFIGAWRRGGQRIIDGSQMNPWKQPYAIAVNSGRNYNKNWGASDIVMQLNYGLNAKVSQIVVLPDNSSTYILKFRYACNTNADFAASSARVLWNEQEVMKIEVHNNEVHMGEVKLTPIEGGNVLTFEGLGEVSNRGLAITDVGVHSDVKPNEKDILLQKLKDRRNRYQNKDDKKPGTVEIKDFTPAPPKTVTPNAPTIQQNGPNSIPPTPATTTVTPVNLPTSSDQATNPYGAKNSLNTDASSTGQVPQTPVVPPIVNNVPINTASPSLPRRIPVQFLRSAPTPNQPPK